MSERGIKPSARRWRDWLVGTLVAMAGLALTAGLFAVSRDWEQERLRARFSQAAAARASLLRSRVGLHLSELKSLARFYEGSQFVERGEFRTFVEPIVQMHRDVLAYEWIRRVSAADRQSHEEVLRLAGLQDYEIRERSPDGGLQAAGPRPVFHPVCYVEPLAGNEAIVGFDLGSNSACLEALEAAETTGQPVATERIALMAGDKPRAGVFVIAPVFRGGALAKAGARERGSLEGFVLVALDAGVSFEVATADLLDPGGIDVLIVDQAAPEQEQILYSRVARPVRQRMETARVARVTERSDLKHTAHVAIAGRRWDLRCTPTPEFLAADRPIQSWVALAAGLLLTGWVTTYVVGSRRRTAHIAAVVEVRTAELGREVVERERTEAALRKSEERFRAIFEQAPVGIAVINSHTGQFVRTNRKFCDICGYAEREMLETTFQHITHPDDLGTQLENMRKLLDGAITFFDMEKRYARKGGAVVWVTLTCVPLWKAADDPRHHLAIVQDITDRKRAEEALRRAHDELEAKVNERTAELAIAKDRAEESDRLKSAFLATMSHELRTPLNSIIGFTGIMLQGLTGPLSDEQSKQLEMVCGSAEHLLSLINDILDISKIEAGQLRVVPEPFDVRESVEKVVGRVTPLAAKSGLALCCHVAPEVGTLASDRRRVEQILLNLVNNAIKFTDRGEVSVECRLEDGRLVTHVRDTGIGIRPGDMDELFVPFHQVHDGVMTRQREGTGLGLAISRKLATMLGGDIRVESQWGVGSTFTLTLPLEARGDSHGSGEDPHHRG